MGCAFQELLVLGIVLALVVTAAGSTNSEAREFQLPCNLKRSYSGVAHSVIDGRTIVLEGGEIVRLSGLAPEYNVDTKTDSDMRGSQGEEADDLKRLVVGRRIIVAPVNPARTRYGETLAHVFSEPMGRDEVTPDLFWVQGALVEGGHARVYEPVGQSECGDKLMELERAAIALKAGLWARPKYRAVDARDVRMLKGLRGSLRRVRGRVLKVASRRRWTYLNFGDVWRQDFTVAISKRVSRAHRNWAKALGDLEGKVVEVSGWIDVRNGPIIELERPGQLQVVSDGVAVERVGDGAR